MARITVEDCLRRENNRFALVILAAKRTKQLLKGSKPHLSEIKNKPVVLALREIADSKVRFMTEEELKEYRERERERAEEVTAAPRPFDARAAADEMFNSISAAPIEPDLSAGGEDE